MRRAYTLAFPFTLRNNTKYLKNKYNLHPDSLENNLVFQACLCYFWNLFSAKVLYIVCCTLKFDSSISHRYSRNMAQIFHLLYLIVMLVTVSPLLLYKYVLLCSTSSFFFLSHAVIIKPSLKFLRCIFTILWILDLHSTLPKGYWQWYRSSWLNASINSS